MFIFNFVVEFLRHFRSKIADIAPLNSKRAKHIMGVKHFLTRTINSFTNSCNIQLLSLKLVLPLSYAHLEFNVLRLQRTTSFKLAVYITHITLRIMKTSTSWEGNPSLFFFYVSLIQTRVN